MQMTKLEVAACINGAIKLLTDISSENSTLTKYSSNSELYFQNLCKLINTIGLNGEWYIERFKNFAVSTWFWTANELENNLPEEYSIFPMEYDEDEYSEILNGLPENLKKYFENFDLASLSV